MKILHISTSLIDGGAEATLFRVIQHDQTNQHLVISLMDLGKYGSKLQAMDIEVYCLNMPRGKITFNGLVKLWQLLKTLQPDVIQTWMYHANLIGGVVARLCGIKRIIWGIRQGNFSNTKTKALTLIIIRFSALFSYFIPSKIVCCAQSAISAHQALGYCKNRFQLIPNGYDLEKLNSKKGVAQRLHAEWNIPVGVPVIGMVARFDPQKDHLNLISALSLLKQQEIAFHCVLIGAEINSDNALLCSWIKAKELMTNITLLGQHEDIAAVMSALDLHVLSSAYGEAFPNVLAEAMACGTPCVATNVGDAGFILGNNGWIIPPEDSTALANGIAIALQIKANTPGSWQALQIAARQHIVEQFSIAKMIAAYNLVWQGN